MDKEKVLALAKLARIEIPDMEAEELSYEFEAILNYVSDIKSVAHSAEAGRDKSDYALKNVMREDGEGHESSIYTEAILSQAPAREGNYLKVKKIL
jgi:aspartyl/glutamyl-tRNA(Asn/Gln) amidotransferase C subunit